MTTLDDQTRELLLAYLSGGTSLDELRRDAMPLFWGLQDELLIGGNPVTARTSLYLAEFARGHRSEEELRDLLSRIAGTVTLNFGTPEPTRTTTTEQKETRFVRYPALAVAGTGA
jgi:hypothetical protein